MELKIIARVRSDYPEKFGIPRQSGLADTSEIIVFEPEYRSPDALRGLDGYSHIWVLWEFSEAARGTWTPMVHPPRLGGKKRMGVFATRSPYRPNPIGLSAVRLDGIVRDEKLGPLLLISGADIMDGTPVYDIKPYLPYADSIPEAESGFAGEVRDYRLSVEFPGKLLDALPEKKRAAAISILEQDPRPPYQNDPSRVYGTAFAGKNIKFRVKDGVLTVCGVEDYADFLKGKK